jgi:hypothetical protein
MFLHKAMKPARVFFNRILSLLREMGDDTRVAISEGAKRDLSWFMACAYAINITVNIYKCLLPQIEIFVDASLKGLGGSVIHLFIGDPCPLTRAVVSLIGKLLISLLFFIRFPPWFKVTGF